MWGGRGGGRGGGDLECYPSRVYVDSSILFFDN